MSDDKIASQPQFGLSAVFWSLVTVSLALAFLRQFDSPQVFFHAAVVVAGAVAMGVFTGWLAGRRLDAVYWAVVIATAAYLSVAGEMSLGVGFQFAWASLGALTGAGCGAIAPGHVVWRVLVGSMIAAATMIFYAALVIPAGTRLGFDLVCAPVVGGLVGLLIEILFWLEQRSSLRRHVTALWLLCAVIAGNLIVPFVLS